MPTVNFVRKRQKELSKVEVQDQKYLKQAFYLIGAVVAVFAIAIGARIGLSLLVNNTNTQINQIKKTIANKQEIEGQYVIFMRKVDILVDLFSQRKEKQEAIAYFSSLFDASLGVRISQLTYTQATHTLDFTLRAPSVFIIQRVFDTLRSSGVRERYPTFSIQRLTRGDDGSYGLVINLPLPTRPADEMLDTEITPLLDEFGEPVQMEGELPLEGAEDTQPEDLPVDEATGEQAPPESVE